LDYSSDYYPAFDYTKKSVIHDPQQVESQPQSHFYHTGPLYLLGIYKSRSCTIILLLLSLIAMLNLQKTGAQTNENKTVIPLIYSNTPVWFYSDQTKNIAIYSIRMHFSLSSCSCHLKPSPVIVLPLFSY
jgi:hypothetical protein